MYEKHKDQLPLLHTVENAHKAKLCHTFWTWRHWQSRRRHWQSRRHLQSNRKHWKQTVKQISRVCHNWRPQPCSWHQEEENKHVQKQIVYTQTDSQLIDHLPTSTSEVIKMLDRSKPTHNMVIKPYKNQNHCLRTTASRNNLPGETLNMFCCA